MTQLDPSRARWTFECYLWIYDYHKFQSIIYVTIGLILFANQKNNAMQSRGKTADSAETKEGQSSDSSLQFSQRKDGSAVAKTLHKLHTWKNK